MTAEGMDPSLLQDFLAEAGELLEQLDGDLVTLESVEDGQAAELLNGIFRALHTIKGAASFLGLTHLTTFAHAAEDALNRLRKGEVQVTTAIMDAMLQSVDVLRGMHEQMSAGEEIEAGPDGLIATLHKIAQGDDVAEGAAADIPPVDDHSDAHQATGESPTIEAVSAAANGSQPGELLELPPQKADLLEFMVADLRDSTKYFANCLEQARNTATKSDAAEHMMELADSLVRTADFFELDDLTRLTKLLQQAAPRLGEAEGDELEELAIRIAAIEFLIEQQATALEASRRLSWPLDTLAERMELIAEGKSLPDDVVAQHGHDVQQLLVLDGVVEPVTAATTDVSAGTRSPNVMSNDVKDVSDALATKPSATTEPSLEAPASNDASGEPRADKNPAKDSGRDGAKKNLVEQTVRVEVNRLEDLLNLVGQMVLTKNRLMALSRRLRDQNVGQDMTENVTQATSDLDRLTGELQVGVMRTRMQPLAKLFDRYPRVIRDIARSTGKQMQLEISGKDTEVDKSVLELLADPLVHLLRNSADHGIESPESRREAGKHETGKIELVAEHQGSHVRVAIVDDGKGLDREILGRKAVERGLVTPEKLASMSDEDVFRFIFTAGFSTAEKVSDLSGRGVGMDVVNNNVSKMNGTINISAAKGKGTTIEILIPLTVAIMPAMMVGVGKHLYAIPLQTVIEIVRPDEQGVYTVAGRPVIRLRDNVLPLVDLRSMLAETGENAGSFAVIVMVGGQKAGLLVDRLVGQQEIVIKPLDDDYTQGGPFSGATIREDGDVSLILDITQLIRNVQTQNVPARAAA